MGFVAKQLIITCEHAGNYIPPEFQPFLNENDPILSTHRGIDIGALDLATQLSKQLNCPFYKQEISRLMIDCNRSLDNEFLFSEYSRDLDKGYKSQLIDVYHVYRKQVESTIVDWLESGQHVLHLSIHTFTDDFYGEIRDGDIGVLFDQERLNEFEFSSQWLKTIARLLPELIVRPNYPYLGTDDGFTTYLRKKMGGNYIGIELEVCQKWVSTASWPNIVAQLSQSLKLLLLPTSKI